MIDDRIVMALRLYQEYGRDAVRVAQAREDEAYSRSHSDWVRWVAIKDSLVRFLEPRP